MRTKISIKLANILMYCSCLFTLVSAQTLEFTSFKSLPSEQGWNYHTNAPEAMFYISDSILVQNTLGIPDVYGSYQIERGRVIDPLNDWTLEIKARVIEIEKPNVGFFFNVLQNNLVYSVRLTPEKIYVFVDKDSLAIFHYNNTQFHDYKITGGPTSSFKLIVDREQLAELTPVNINDLGYPFHYELAFGDGTSQDSMNAHGEWASYVFSQERTNPLIAYIEDVPNDQGGWVKVHFYKSEYDTDSLVLAKDSSAEMYTIECNDGSGWYAAASTAAYGKSVYSVLVHTTKDSTTDDNGLIAFRVIAAMEEGNFASASKFGYSVDNISPHAPDSLKATLIGEKTISLTWYPAQDRDLKYYNIYRNTTNIFDESSEFIDVTAENYYTDTQVEAGQTYYYAVKSVDQSGNQSHYSESVSVSLTTINDERYSFPNDYFINQNYPNPFNPVTTITYGLPQSANVTLKIYDINGRLIKILVNDIQNAGTYRIQWDGLNNTGNSTASGIYIYRFESDNFQSTNKMILMR